MKTIKIKIAVAIDSNGTWSAAGWGDEEIEDRLQKHLHESNVMNEAESIQEMTDPVNSYWITAEIEMPEKPEIKEIEASKITKESGLYCRCGHLVKIHGPRNGDSHRDETNSNGVCGCVFSQSEATANKEAE